MTKYWGRYSKTYLRPEYKWVRVGTLGLPLKYGVDSKNVKEILRNLKEYGLIDVDVENAASIFDDLLRDEGEKIRYALQLIEENGIDSAHLVVIGNRGTIVVKIGGVVLIRAEIKEYKKLIRDFKLEAER